MSKLQTIILSFILLFGFGTVAFGAFGDPFISLQVGTSPSSGYVLQTDGTNSTWVDISTIATNPFNQWLDTTSTVQFFGVNANSLTTTDSLYIGGYASSTGGLFTQGNLHVGGNSVFDGTVGIGTESPAESLEIATGSILLPNNEWLQWRGSGGSPNSIMKLNAANDTVINSVGTNDILFQDGGVTVALIDENGYLAVGTTTPAEILTISDSGVGFNINDTRNITWSVGDILSSINFLSDDTSSSYGGFARASINTVQDDTFGANVGLSFWTRDFGDYAERLKITGDGMVGIATSTPYGKLSVVDTTSGRPTIIGTGTMGSGYGIYEGYYSNSTKPADAGFFTLGLFQNNTGGAFNSVYINSGNSTGNSRILFGDVDDSDITRIVHDNSANDLGFWTSNTERVTITSSGAVGIGDPTPDGIFQAGGTTNYATISAGGDLTFAGGGDYLVGGNDYAFRYANNQDFGLYFNQTTAGYDFLTSGGSIVVKLGATTGIDSYFLNDVGIGTTNPTTDLHVYDASAPALIAIENTGNGNYSGIQYTRERNTGTGVAGACHFVDSDTSTSNATWILDVDTSVGCSQGFSAQQRFSVGSDGYAGFGNLSVGIGTFTPATDLEVYGHASSTQLTVGLDGFSGAGLTDCDAADSALTWDSTTKLFGCNTISGGSGVKDSINIMVQDGKIGHLTTSPKPAKIDGSQNRWYMSMDDTNDDDYCADYQFTMPETYSASMTLYTDISYTFATSTSGNVVVYAQIMATSDGDSASLETDSFDTANSSAATTIPATGNYLDKISLTMTNKDSIAAGDLTTLRVCRDSNNASDTAVNELQMAGIILRWE